MFATLNFMSHQAPAVVVPTEAVISTGERSVVILADTEGKFRPMPVTTGRTSGDMTEIRAGLTAGQKVVVSGQFLIDSEASLRGVLTRMNEPAPPAQAVPSPKESPK
jgi:Cu(I)/Ag(I) efflux system membrane fusion protein